MSNDYWYDPYVIHHFDMKFAWFPVRINKKLFWLRRYYRYSRQIDDVRFGLNKIFVRNMTIQERFMIQIKENI